ncbi:MbtH family protein [Amycolatopsis acidiphila]|uniref:MbtH family protein n=1 Tax=Amycolatopsis acidiphila TaxID=715473 RepID=A0A557ZX59_9PSEU|nr:MbtH family protein [Amycolatopsis acidiphila]TVT16603.1 MbtH family protein [Amycolatopsis acidiphila]UIJ62051.1 MbtH family protein [Amycolatopsis acidiphila]GHG98947.1 protein MbtH [Amycolatopsis acidiphila]
MSTNPFDDEAAEFLVLVNAEEQRSLWPTFAEIPAGWRAVHGPDSRAGCLAHVEATWKSIRPLSARERD